MRHTLIIMYANRTEVIYEMPINLIESSAQMMSHSLCLYTCAHTHTNISKKIITANSENFKTYTKIKTFIVFISKYI